MNNTYQKKQPLLSVIVPVYNVESYLEKCVNSIINQTYANLEIILVNDGSSDSSGKICDFFKEKDSRVIVIHQQNQGQSVARNVGLAQSNGDYISFIDSDDWIKLNMYTYLIDSMLSNDLQIIECDIITNTNLDGIIVEYPSIVIEDRNEFMYRTIKNEQFSVCRRIYKRDLLSGLSFIANKLYEDLFFSIEVLNRVNKLGYIAFPFYVYYVERGDSTMRSSYNQKKLNSIDAGIFVVNNTLNFEVEVKKSAKNFLIKFLGWHYNDLFESPEFDLDLKHRKKIRSTVKEYFNEADFYAYGYMIKILPIWLYNIFYKFNRARINLQLKLLRS